MREEESSFGVINTMFTNHDTGNLSIVMQLQQGKYFSFEGLLSCIYTIYRHDMAFRLAVNLRASKFIIRFNARMAGTTHCEDREA